MNRRADNAAPTWGVHAATLCPMEARTGIDEPALVAHLEAVGGSEGINGLLVNGHAGEGGVLSLEERRRVLDHARRVLPSDKHLCAGVFGESTTDAERAARDAAEAGADSVLVFPPNAWALGHDAAMAVLHHRRIADAGGLPLVLYKAPLAAGRMSYELDTLRALVELPATIAIKEGSWEVAAYEASRRAVHAIRPEVAVLGSGDEHLFTSYAIGTEGSQVSLAAIVPRLVVELFEAMQRGDLDAARQRHALIYPLAEAIYGQAPAWRATARLKTCLMLLGRCESDAVRAPCVATPEEERAALRVLLAGERYSGYGLSDA